MRPCIPGDRRRQHCLAALLHGVSCCSSGDCALCRGAERALRRAGRDEAAVSAAMLATWYTTLDRCPVCHCPPPPPIAEIPPMPAFARRSKHGIVSCVCMVCGRGLPPRRISTCSRDCAMEYRSDVEGWEYMSVRSSREEREYRIALRIE